MRPISVGIGVAAILAVGGVTVPAAALAADATSTAGTETAPVPSDPPSDSPSEPAPDPTTPTPPTPPTPPATPKPRPSIPHPPSSPSAPPHRPAASLSIRLSLSSHTAAPGGTVAATVAVAARHALAHNAVVRLSAPGADTEIDGALGDLGPETRQVSGLVKIAAGHAAGTVMVTASVRADQAGTRTATRRVTVITTGGSDPAPGRGSKSGRGSNSGHAGSGPMKDIGGSNLPLIPAPMVSPVPVVAPAPEQPRLPLIAPAPVVAPPPGDPATSAAAPQQDDSPTEIVMRANVSALGVDRTSLRLIWTEVAWLVVLLVATSLLLTQLRLNRRRR